MTDNITPITNVDLMVDPDDDSAHAVYVWLKAHGYCVAIFIPDEIGSTDTETMQSKMIEAGWDAIYGNSELRIIDHING